MRLPLLLAWESALHMKWTRQRCHVAFMTLETATLMPRWASEMTSFIPTATRSNPHAPNRACRWNVSYLAPV
jgi:hypothetical protein